MDKTRMVRAALLACAVAMAVPLNAATPRELLAQAAFQTTDKANALALVEQARIAAEALLVANPHDREAEFQRGIAIGDRAHLTHSPGDAKAARHIFETLVASNPRDPEAHLAVATWHLDSVEAGFLVS